jgi:protein-arginine kinase activator protein McsA
METITFERGKNPMESMGIGKFAKKEYYRKKKMEAVRNQNFEEAAMWRGKEREIEDEITNNRG